MNYILLETTTNFADNMSSIVEEGANTAGKSIFALFITIGGIYLAINLIIIFFKKTFKKLSNNTKNNKKDNK